MFTVFTKLLIKPGIVALPETTFSSIIYSKRSMPSIVSKLCIHNYHRWLHIKSIIMLMVWFKLKYKERKKEEKKPLPCRTEGKSMLADSCHSAFSRCGGKAPTLQAQWHKSATICCRTSCLRQFRFTLNNASAKDNCNYVFQSPFKV